jgi:ubiquinone/menaquinone biosynthesis C-methylase UbiE
LGKALDVVVVLVGRQSLSAADAVAVGRQKTMSQTYTKEEIAKRYDSARALPAEALTLAMETLRKLLPPKRVNSVLDLGAGTGRFCQSLQETWRCSVIAIDPSEAMLTQGKSRWPDNNIEWRQGSAENLPLGSDSVDLVWMCQVFHHLEDPALAFQEIRRVLMPGGCLAIRNGTRENEAELEWSSCFPEAQQIDNERLPSRQDLIDLACSQGFENVAVQTVYQLFASSYAEYYEKISRRGLSSLISISDEAFDAGLKRLKQWVAEQPAEQAVYEPVDLLVFQVNK